MLECLVGICPTDMFRIAQIMNCTKKLYSGHKINHTSISKRLPWVRFYPTLKRSLVGETGTCYHFLKTVNGEVRIIYCI